MSTTLTGLVSVTEAAKIIGVTDSLVRRWCRKGVLPKEKLGHAYAIPRWAVDQKANEDRRPGPKKAG